MKYDLFNQDPKNIVCFTCDDMTIYSAPPRVDFEKKVFWINHKTHNTDKDGENDNSRLNDAAYYPQSGFTKKANMAQDDRENVETSNVARSPHSITLHRRQP